MAKNKKTLKIGNHRGGRRLWIESGVLLDAAGFVCGTEFRVSARSRGVRLVIADNGTHTVATSRRGAKVRPIVDVKLKDVPDHVTHADVLFAAGSITVTWR